MIPQEKIEQAAKEYGDKAADQAVDITLSDLKEYAATDFTAGVRFAEAEMKQIMNEYGQWLADMWSDDHAQCHYNPELYTKFDEERGRNDL